MFNSIKKTGGAYLRSHHKHNTLPKFVLLGLVIVMVCVLAFTQAANAEAKPIYHLPDEVPSFCLPANLTDNFGTVMDYAEMYVGQTMTGQGMSM